MKTVGCTVQVANCALKVCWSIHPEGCIPGVPKVQKDTTLSIAVKGAIKTIKTKEHVNTTRTIEPSEDGTFNERVLRPLLQLVITLIVLLLVMRWFRR